MFLVTRAETFMCCHTSEESTRLFLALWDILVSLNMLKIISNVDRALVKLTAFTTELTQVQDFTNSLQHFYWIIILSLNFKLF